MHESVLAPRIQQLVLRAVCSHSEQMPKQADDYVDHADTEDLEEARGEGLPHGTSALDRGLTLLQLIVTDAGERPLSELADVMGLPASSARRMVGLLLRRGLVIRVAPGHFAAGPALLALPGPQCIVADLARPVMLRLARTIQATVHLGLLDEDMVTYIAKAHGGGPEILTQEGTQLEAYCSAVGKVLLSMLPDRSMHAYLAAGPFVALTDKTQTDPQRIRQQLLAVRAQGWAVEQGEVQEGLGCIAVPIPRLDAALPPSVRRLALSISRVRDAPLSARMLAEDQRRLEACAARIAKLLNRT